MDHSRHEGKWGSTPTRCVACGLPICLVAACDEDGFTMEPHLPMCSVCYTADPEDGERW